MQRGRAEVGEDHVGFEVEREEVGHQDLALEPVGRQRLLGLVGESLVDLDAYNPGAAPGRGDQHLTVAAAEVDEAVAATQVRQVERDLDTHGVRWRPERPAAVVGVDERHEPIILPRTPADARRPGGVVRCLTVHVDERTTLGVVDLLAA